MRWSFEHLEDNVAWDFQRGVRKEEDSQSKVVLIASEFEILVHARNFGIANIASVQESEEV